MKCPHCGSKDTLVQPYSVFCNKCSMESMTVKRSKVDGPVPSAVLTLPPQSSWKPRTYFCLGFLSAVQVIAIFGALERFL